MYHYCTKSCIASDFVCLALAECWQWSEESVWKRGCLSRGPILPWFVALLELICTDRLWSFIRDPSVNSLPCRLVSCLLSAYSIVCHRLSLVGALIAVGETETVPPLITSIILHVLSNIFAKAGKLGSLKILWRHICFYMKVKWLKDLLVQYLLWSGHISPVTFWSLL